MLFKGSHDKERTMYKYFIIKCFHMIFRVSKKMTYYSLFLGILER